MIAAAGGRAIDDVSLNRDLVGGSHMSGSIAFPVVRVDSNTANLLRFECSATPADENPELLFVERLPLPSLTTRRQSRSL